MSPAIWRKSDEEWRPLLPSSFPSEEALHDLVEEAPNLLPLSGDPTLTILGREVAIGPGFADLVAVDDDGRLTVIEIKLRKNAEARRAVVAQILTYAAYLKGSSVDDLEAVLRPHLGRIDATSIADAVQRSDQSGQFDELDGAERVNVEEAIREARNARCDLGATSRRLIVAPESNVIRKRSPPALGQISRGIGSPRAWAVRTLVR